MSRVSKFRKSALGFTVATMLAISITPLQSASALAEWALSEYAVSLGITGVSPHVKRTGNADRLWYPGGRADERRDHDAGQTCQRTE